MTTDKSIINLFAAVTIWFVAAGFGNFPTFLQQDLPDNPRLPAVAAYNFDHYAYLPLVSYRNASNFDLRIEALEPTQAIQTDSNSVPMIANRATVLRVYTKSGYSASATNVRVSVTATRNGAALSGSPLISSPGVVPVNWSRGDISTSFNLRLPAAWLSGTVNLVVRVDSSNTYNETNEGNNSAAITLNFQTSPAFDVKVVPMNFYSSGDLYSTPDDTSYLSTGLRKIYPVAGVSVSRRTAITVDCDFSDTQTGDDCWDDTLDDVTTLKKSDHAPLTQFYYGIVPVGNIARTWFYGGTAGLGWIGGDPSESYNGRTSIGLGSGLTWFDAGLIAAHEIGHNLGRRHAPCDVSGDTNYPYANGMIGFYGLDTSTLQVYSPDVYSDVMGYCDKQWISDYTYKGLLSGFQNNIGAGSYPPGIADGLLVRARLSDATNIELSPAYAFSGLIDPPAAGSEYAVEFLDESGQVVDRYPVGVLTASEPGIEVRRINTLVPMPSRPFASYRLARQGETLAQRDLSARPALAAPAETPAAISASPNTLLITWSTPQTPAIVRYTSDGGQTWNTLALDQLGGALSVALDTLPEGKIQIQIISADSFGKTWTLDWEK